MLGSGRTERSAGLGGIISIGGSHAGRDAVGSVRVGECWACRHAQVPNVRGGSKGCNASASTHINIAISTCGAHSDTVVRYCIGKAFCTSQLAGSSAILCESAGSAVGRKHAIVR